MKTIGSFRNSSALNPSASPAVGVPAATSFDQLAAILREMGERGSAFNPVRHDKKTLSPMDQKAFYEALRTGEQSAETLHRQLVDIQASRKAERDDEDFKSFDSVVGILPDLVQDWLYDLRTKCKAEKEFLKTSFNIFSSPDPLEKVTESVGKFDDYCRRNGISYDEAAQALVAGEPPKTAMDHVKEMRFVIAAVGGAAAGLAGLDLGTVPVLKDSVGLFFTTGMPWLAAGFISLNMYKSFLETDLKEASGTLGRFAAVTAAGFGISYLVTTAMSGVLPPVDVSSIKELAEGALGGGDDTFNPMRYMLYFVGGATACSMMHKGALVSLQKDVGKAVDGAGSVLRRVAFNDVTTPAVLAAGDKALKGAAFFNTAFPAFINYVGIPAVATVLSQTMASGGVDQLAAYSNYYITAGTGLGVGGVAMLGAYYFAGCRAQDLKEAGKAFKEGFFLSSSSAVLPKERICLLNMGVSRKTADSVLPLAGVFNMYGTSLYLGLTAFYAMSLFNSDPTLGDYMATAGAAFAIAMGAPGAPSSNVVLLDPVLQQTGLLVDDIHKIYAMVLPADRILDMTQTGMNVLGDMYAAIWQDHKLIREKNALQRSLPPPPGQA